jgi:formate hydrogenlyase transcriptional activator
MVTRAAAADRLSAIVESTANTVTHCFWGARTSSGRRPPKQDRARRNILSSLVSQPQANLWLLENGPKELERLFRAIAFYPLAPILLTDDDRHYREASVGASKLLGLPREEIIGRSLDDFTDPDFKPVISERWNALLSDGEQQGTIPLIGMDGTPHEVEYVAKGEVLPVRHVLVLRDKASNTGVPAWVQDYALFLLDVEGQIVAWYRGAERI